jgi:hypothetical protein
VYLRPDPNEKYSHQPRDLRVNSVETQHSARGKRPATANGTQHSSLVLYFHASPLLNILFDNFEKYLVDNGIIVVKFLLNCSKSAQNQQQFLKPKYMQQED